MRKPRLFRVAFLTGLMCIGLSITTLADAEIHTCTDENPADNLCDVCGISVNTEINYNVQVGGIAVTSSNASDVLGDGTVSYDAFSNTLTLKNLNITPEGANYGINAEGDLNMVLEGESFVHNDGVCGIRTAGTLTISGTGTLHVYGEDYGIYSKADINIRESVVIDAVCGDIVSGDNFGIRANNDIKICENTKVSALAGYAPNYSYGIYAGNDFTACDNAVITTKAGKGESRSCGLYAISNIFIKDSSSIDTTGVDNNDSADEFNDSYGIRTTQLYSYGGTLVSKAGNTNLLSAGIYTQEMEVDGGSVEAIAGNTDKGPSNGLQVTTKFIVKAGAVSATAGDAIGDASTGIQVGGTMTMEDGVVSTISGNGYDTWGLCADEMTINNGYLSVATKGAEGASRGIQAMQSLTINGGMIDVYVGKAASSYGVQSASMITIKDVFLNITCVDTVKSSGIWAFEGVSITDSTVFITTEGIGINVPFGTVEVIGTNVIPLEELYELTGINLVINANGEYGIYAGVSLTVSDNLSVFESGSIKELTKDEEPYWTIVDEDGNVLSTFEIAPSRNTVIINGLDSEMVIQVLPNKSVNDTYAELCQVSDFSELLDVTKEGYTFGGWYTDENCTEGNEFTFAQVISEDINVYAKWIKEESNDTTEDDKDQTEDTDKEDTDKEDTNKEQNTEDKDEQKNDQNTENKDKQESSDNKKQSSEQGKNTSSSSNVKAPLTEDATVCVFMALMLAIVTVAGFATKRFGAL